MRDKGRELVATGAGFRLCSRLRMEERAHVRGVNGSRREGRAQMR